MGEEFPPALHSPNSTEPHEDSSMELLWANVGELDLDQGLSLVVF